MGKVFLILISAVIAFANIGKITGIKGEVYIQRDSKVLGAYVGNKLELHDKIITKDKSKALILFNDKTSITVGKDSTLEVDKYIYTPDIASKNEASFKFGNGVFRTITGKIGKLNKKKFRVKTVNASIGIRGTIFNVEVKKDFLAVEVEDGGVSVIPNDKDVSPLNVNPNETMVYNVKDKKAQVMISSKYQSINDKDEDNIESVDDPSLTLEDEKVEDSLPTTAPVSPKYKIELVDYSYLKVGYKNAPEQLVDGQNIAESDLTKFEKYFDGVTTVAGHMGMMDSATYNGTFGAIMTDSQNKYTTGNISIGINIDSSVSISSISMTVGSYSLTGVQSSVYMMDDDTGREGILKGTFNVNAPMTSAEIEARFYGTNAEALAGSFKIKGDSMGTTFTISEGIFGAKK
jgi:hypothetical protein